MKAREPSSLLRLRSSFVVIPSGRSIYIYIYTSGRLFLSSRRRERGTRMWGWKRRGWKGKKIAGVRFPSPETGRKGIIIISRGLGLLKRKQTPLPGKNRLGWNVLPSRWKLYPMPASFPPIFGGNFASLLSYPPGQLSPWKRRKRILTEMENGETGSGDWTSHILWASSRKFA